MVFDTMIYNANATLPLLAGPSAVRRNEFSDILVWKFFLDQHPWNIPAWPYLILFLSAALVDPIHHSVNVKSSRGNVKRFRRDHFNRNMADASARIIDIKSKAASRLEITRKYGGPIDALVESIGR